MFYSFSGFGEAFVFKELSTEDIVSIENFVRNDLPILLKAALDENGVTYTTAQKACFFGPYAAAPEMFRFSPGDSKLILNMVRYVKRIVDEPEENAGLEHFTDISALDKKELQYEKHLACSVFGLVFGHLERKPLLANQSKQALFVKVQELFSKYASDKAVQQRNLSLDMIEVQKDADKIKAKITCTFCKEGDLGAVVCIAFRPPGSWIMSNIDAHLKKKHPHCLVKSEGEPSGISNNESFDETNANMDVKSSLEYPKDESVEASNQINGLTMDINSSMRSLEGAFTEMSTNSKENHAGMDIKSYEDVIFDQLSVQSTRMTKSTTRNQDKLLTNSFGVRQAKVKQEKAIKFCKMAGNGDCFFLAVSHQLYNVKAGTEEHTQIAHSLRESVVNYIKQDEQFLNFLHDLKTRVGTDHNATDIEIKAECMNFLDKLSKTGTWAGMESIRAISEMRNVNIVVMNDDGTSYLPNHFNPEANRTIMILFGTTNKKPAKTNMERDHYDSIVTVTSKKIELMSKEIDEAETRYTKFITAHPNNITIT